ncbi:uncharacterized protein JCM15063_004779 [Sporobolomyces koalae]|uniref:uncharacterized protein n=1 Tax=Sporobolomyces koalae TaxID=500713 RepID=UPI003171976D
MLKTIAAHKLGPTIEQELAHASQPGACRVARDLGIVITCDACLHVILCGGWICQLCGHELCFDCHAIVRLFEANARGESSPELDGLPKASLARIMTCWGRNKHGTTDFVPLTRIDADRLLQTVVDMKTWRECHPLELGNILSPKWADQYLYQPPEEDNSHPYLKLPSNVLPSTTTNETLQDIERSREDEDAPVNIFRALWSRGEAMVVDLDLSEVSRVLWTPQYFIDQFGQAPVTIASNILGRPDRLSTVGEFFSTFGQSTGLVNSEKIKASRGILHSDWPPSSDFRKDFPLLWEDFMRMVPIGSVTRRDGILNVSTHTPKNANPPDLGPKGYFSETSDDSEGGQGSTKLHTVNVLLWSAKQRDGSPGYAVWDLYRVEDADKIREFLYELIAVRDYQGDVARAKRTNDDPIHTQRFFLNEKLRQDLWEKKQVKSWRIRQTPGQVVFIPAGCAHQVCNFADCIKVASDFVSLENVARCWIVSDEFRKQTREGKLWRTDVLSLKSQLLWAWESAQRLNQII